MLLQVFNNNKKKNSGSSGSGVLFPQLLGLREDVPNALVMPNEIFIRSAVDGYVVSHIDQK